MKKILSVFLLIAIILSVTACGTAGTKNANESSADARESSQVDQKEQAQTEASTSDEAEEPEAPQGNSPAESKSDSASTAAGEANPPVGGGDGYFRHEPELPEPPANNEEYDDSQESGFIKTATESKSTFSVDVDTASYSNMRRQIIQGQQPQGIRIEEMLNYFSYDYPNPKRNSDAPFSITTQVAQAPWNPSNHLAMIGIQGESMTDTASIHNNIVFLIDVSGSMASEERLPLLKQAMNKMIGNFNENDRISIITYSGQEEILADSIPGHNHKLLVDAVDSLYASGVTAGETAMERAYDLASRNFIEGGNNRIILATDGDYNVGINSAEDLISFVEEKRETGVFISVLGFGMGNLKDHQMESIANNGNGNYYYIDNLIEAEKVLVDEFDSMMYTIAKDVKLQVDFNPAVVKEYRLIGYDNRRLANEDFEDDTKDAGEIGAGHSVTAFYELVLMEEGETIASGSKYQEIHPTGSDDYMTVSVRYKEPTGEKSHLVEHAVEQNSFVKSPNSDFRFAAAVVEFGLILSGSEYTQKSTLSQVLKIAEANTEDNPFRKEFVELVKEYQSW